MKTKKRKKSVRQRGNTTYGHGARKKWKKSGHRGGCGMAGTGKRGDQKKSWIIKKYGNEYFGKQGVTSRSTAKRVNKVINLEKIEKNFDSLMKRFGKSGVLDLSEFKLLGNGGLNRKIKLKVREASKSAVKEVERAGGSVEVLKSKKDIINTKKDKKSIEKSGEEVQSENSEDNSIEVNNKIKEIE